MSGVLRLFGLSKTVTCDSVTFEAVLAVTGLVMVLDDFSEAALIVLDHLVLDVVGLAEGVEVGVGV